MKYTISPHFDDLTPALLQHKRATKWNAYDKSILPAWVAESDLPTAEPIRQVIEEMAALSDFGYPTTIDKSVQELREVAALRLNTRYQLSTTAKHIEVITDVMQGIYLSLQAFTEKGDGVIVQTPIYPPFVQSVYDMQRSLIENPLQQESNGTYSINFADLKRKILPNTRVLLLCNPHNPTGRVFTLQELQTLADIALEHNLLVFSDEIHADIIYDEAKHIPIASLSPEIAARTITFNSATKAFSIPGLRCAIAAFGSEALQQQFNQAAPAGLRGGVSLFGLHATLAAFKNGDAWLQKNLAYLKQNREMVKEFAKKYLPQSNYQSPEATYLAWMDCSSLNLPQKPYTYFLERAKVALSDGENFHPSCGHFVRLNFSTSRAILHRILQQMAQSID